MADSARDLYDLAVAARAEPRALAVALNTLSPRALDTRLLRWERPSFSSSGALASPRTDPSEIMRTIAVAARGGDPILMGHMLPAPWWRWKRSSRSRQAASACC